ncbi:GPI ethanolamine phosphate transferase 2 [Hondaea fermentalgiana]|uniref:GPI ethanolamine phosphate transferase 2 n=1 Tax=Hondaea fermentalgiana TaxID=2315210 RepID=A0A2R5G5B3_9STRA|nr:GPI ethanolamine phosphate transferase 2 [Hondaea fermentalgiana]|eukprot:GBG24978.1 GPI ethanolamine phosphate transferase 2 [Hondaea fermentalgiana]
MQKGARAFARAVLVAAALHFAGLLLFNEGFFLTRVELPHKSSCAEPPRDNAHAATKSNSEKRTASTHGGCWTRPRFKRAVVLVIDALRYDFAAWDPDAEYRDAQRPFENKMPAIRDLLMLRPAHSMLVPFFADPPTTTMQRLKGIVTGGLPTFMEIKDDVARAIVPELFFVGESWLERYRSLNEAMEVNYRACRGLEGSAIVALLWSMASMSYFFATGHESFFNKLHYASPFVGFDEYEYFRGGLMMGSNTFGVYMACRSIVMTAFVAAERRHLMVWAIFAPKYVFDGVTLLVVDVVTLLLTAKLVFSKDGNSTKSAPTT